MPAASSKNAPHKFKGSYKDVRSFLSDYEHLCRKHAVISSKDKIDSIFRYCSESVNRSLKSMDSYIQSRKEKADWEAFKEEFWELFDADRSERHYKIRHLTAFIKKSKLKQIKYLSKWKEYRRKFLKMSRYLREDGAMIQSEEDLQFWKGLHRKTRTYLQLHLQAKYPDHDLKSPFSVAQVNEIAQQRWGRQNFDQQISDTEQEYSDSDSDDSDDSSDEDSESDNETSSSEDEDRIRKKKRKSAKHKSTASKTHKKKTKKRKSSHSSEDDEQKEKSNKSSNKSSSHVSQDDDVEDLAEQLSKLQIDDPIYMITYLKACMKTPSLANVLKRPAALQANNQPIAPRIPRPFTAAVGNIANATPATGTNMDRSCFGCGDKNHTLANCLKMQELLQQGIVIKNNMGRFVMKDGSNILRNMNEPFYPAVQRQIGATTNTAQVHYATTSIDPFTLCVLEDTEQFVANAH
ncbi:uncharacterized protein B0H18DRAFT_882448 [Fomitopsis serialis]|uniref:uncharacterized protein n=1 Tax=Fomitopsis serialis TaxID=139415 RepID=UPI002007D6BB|nr:uncharacterized protein B0H18DRAFT_882448 [Neoantrodia serialis]KAH9918983.1 hypothetical protein B0H18DRAFT_882448 [Neoantrodia serialis]